MKHSAELTWEEKNPINYLYYSSDALERLKEILKAEEAKLSPIVKKNKGRIDERKEVTK